VAADEHEGIPAVTRNEGYVCDSANRLHYRNINGGLYQLVQSDLECNTTQDAHNARATTTAGPGTVMWRYMTWDAQNRMVQSTFNSVTTQYAYGPDGLRRLMVPCDTSGNPLDANATHYALDGQSVVQEWKTSGAGKDWVTYLAGPNGPSYRLEEKQNGVNTLRWYVYDGLGCVLAEIDGDGNTMSARVYDVYGGVRRTAGTPTSRHGYVGQLGHSTDGESGLTYMRARYMHPETGRFVSEDPSYSGGNWFAYANDDPVGNVDLTGEASVGWFFIGSTSAMAGVLAALAPGYLVGPEKAAALAAAVRFAGWAITSANFAMSGGDHPANLGNFPKWWLGLMVSGSILTGESEKIGRGFAFVAVEASFVYAIVVAGSIDAIPDTCVEIYA
jgi:RHS repeat-associated protein